MKKENTPYGIALAEIEKLRAELSRLRSRVAQLESIEKAARKALDGFDLDWVEGEKFIEDFKGDLRAVKVALRSAPEAK